MQILFQMQWSSEKLYDVCLHARAKLASKGRGGQTARAVRQWLVWGVLTGQQGQIT